MQLIVRKGAAPFGKQELADAMGQPDDQIGEFLINPSAEFVERSEPNGGYQPTIVGFALMHAATVGIKLVRI